MSLLKFSSSGDFMQSKNNLRFFLALGNQKVIVLENKTNTQIYSGFSGKRINVSLNNLTQAFAIK